MSTSSSQFSQFSSLSSFSELLPTPTLSIPPSNLLTPGSFNIWFHQSLLTKLPESPSIHLSSSFSSPSPATVLIAPSNFLPPYPVQPVTPLLRTIIMAQCSNTEFRTRSIMLLLLLQFVNEVDIGYTSLVPRPHPLTRRNGLVNQVEFLGLAHAFATM